MPDNEGGWLVLAACLALALGLVTLSLVLAYRFA
jgi:hypothetical protein